MKLSNAQSHALSLAERGLLEIRHGCVVTVPNAQGWSEHCPTYATVNALKRRRLVAVEPTGQWERLKVVASSREERHA